MSKRPMSEIGRMLECDVPPVMPVLPLMSTVVFPLGVTSIQIRLEQSKALLRDHAEPGELIALVYSPARREKDLSATDLSKIGWIVCGVCGGSVCLLVAVVAGIALLVTMMGKRK